MNAIRQHYPDYTGEPFAFETVEQLFETPLVRDFTSRPEITHLGSGGQFLWALDSRGPYWRLVGLLDEKINLRYGPFGE